MSTNYILSFLLLSCTGALIGWVTNWLAIKMLFRPREPLRLFGLSFQGLVPRRQKDLAEKIADTIEQRLISHRDVQEILQSKETQRDIERLITQQIDIFLAEKLRAIPMVQMFLQGDIALQIKALLIDQFRGAIPSFVDGLMDQVENNLHFKEIVRQKVESFDLGTLEEMIYAIAAKELRAIELLGGVLGFAVGASQALLLMALSS